MITLYVIDLETEAGKTYMQTLQNHIIYMNPKTNDEEVMDNMNVGIQNYLMYLYEPNLGLRERRIGNTTFSISSWFNNSKPCDIATKIARLIQHENAIIPSDDIGMGVVM